MNTIKIDARNTRMIAHRGVCGLEREIGTLEVGARADLLVIEAETDTLSAVYSAGERCVEDAVR